MSRHSRSVSGVGRLLTALTVIALCLVPTLFIVHPLKASAESDSSSDLVLISQSSSVGNAEGAFIQMSLQLSSSLVGTIDDQSRLVITSHRPVESRQEVHSAIDGDLPQIIDAVEYALPDLLVGATDSTGSARIDLTIRTEIGRRTPEALQMSATGVYPLTIDIEQAGKRLLGLVSFIERIDRADLASDTSDPIALAIVGRLEAPISLDPSSRIVVASSTRKLMNDWVSLLERRPEAALTLAARPELLDAFARSIPEDRELLIRLQRAATFEMLSTTYVRMDPSDTDRHSLTSIFARQLRLGESTLSSLFPTLVTPRQTWLQTAPLTTGGARFLADLGFRTVVLAPDAWLSEDSDSPTSETVDPTRLTALDLTDAGTLDAATIDQDLARALDRGSLAPQGGEHLVAQQVLADLKMMRLEMRRNATESETNALVLSGVSGDMPSPAMTEALFDVITRDSRFTFTRLATALGVMARSESTNRIDLPDSLDPSRLDPARATLNSVVDGLESVVDAYASALPRNDDRVKAWREVLDVIPDDRLDIDQRQTYIDAIRSETQQIASTIVPPASTTFTLGGRNSPIRFSIRNDGKSDLQVRVRLRSSKLRLSEADKVISLPAGTSTAVEFAVGARSNGRFPVTLQLLTPEGEVPLGTPSTLTARVNALAGLGQLVTGIALLFLASWWVHHFRKEYRKRQDETDLSSQRHPSGDRSA